MNSLEHFYILPRVLRNTLITQCFRLTPTSTGPGDGLQRCWIKCVLGRGIVPDALQRCWIKCVLGRRIVPDALQRCWIKCVLGRRIVPDALQRCWIKCVLGRGIVPDAFQRCWIKYILGYGTWTVICFVVGRITIGTESAVHTNPSVASS
jgi:hypothetical protein